MREMKLKIRLAICQSERMKRECLARMCVHVSVHVKACDKALKNARYNGSCENCLCE